MKSRYVVVTPVRDEEEYIKYTLESMLAQSTRPLEWVIVNDGSQDSTGKIIDEYARKHDWITPVHRANRGFRKYGGGIIEAFYDGYDALSRADWDYLVKLDGDFSFESDYFERCFRHFQEEPLLGIGGGFLYHMVNGKKVPEACPLFHVRGGTKIYRRACWDAIGGLWVGLGSDTIDEVKANMLGWRTMSFEDAQLLHHRFTGSAGGLWGGIVKNGKTDYVCGYHPLFMIAKCGARLFKKPYIIEGFGIFWGYLVAQLTGIPRVDDPALIKYVRSQQLARLMGRKTIWQ